MMEASEKLELFSKTVFKEASEEANKMVREARKQKDERILGVSDRYLAAAEKRIENEKDRISAELVKSTASKKLSASKEILTLRATLIGKIFDSVEERVKEYRLTPDYEKKLLSLCLDANGKMGNAPCEIKLSKDDMKYESTLLSKLPAGSIAASDKTIKLGGLKMRSLSGNMLIDYSFDCEMEAQRELFTSEDRFRLE